MAIQIGDYILVPLHEVDQFRDETELRRFFQNHLGGDLTGFESQVKALGGGPTLAVRIRNARPGLRHVQVPVSSPPLRDLTLSRFQQPLPPLATAPVQETIPWVAFQLLTDEGAPIPEVQLNLTDGWGFEMTVTTDSDGRVRAQTALEAPHKVRVLSLPIKLPEPPTELKRTEGFVLARETGEPVVLTANKAYTLVVARPRATVVSVDGWWENQKVLVFQSARDTDKGPVTVRGILRQALCSPKGGEIHVVGHADTNGATSDNDSLANIRAQSVYLYLSGKRQEWAEHAFANADVATLQAALFWVSLNSLVECDPGPVDGDWGPVTSFGLTMLRLEAGISPSAQLGPDDWAAIYDRFDEGLAMLLLTDQAGLAAARARVQVVDPVSKGERFPVDAPTLNGHDCPANRRVDIIFCNPGAIPAPESDEIYDGTFALDYLVVTPECRVQIFATNPKMEPIPFARVLVQVGILGQRWLTTNVGASIEFTALRSDRMRIFRGTEPGGSGNMINNGLQEALLVAQQALGELE